MSETPFLDWLRDAPLWAVGLILFALQMGARELAAAWQRRRHRRSSDLDREASQFAVVVAAILGLQALLIGFTFNLALNRFESRQGYADQEAKALLIVHERLSVFRDGAQLQPALAAHSRQRWQEVIGAVPQADGADAMRREAELWERAVAIAKAEPSPALTTFLLVPLGDALQSADNQALERARRIVGSVLLMLVVLAVTAAAALGLTTPGARMRPISAMLFALVTLAQMTILDLDQANSGRIRMSDTAWRQTVAEFESEWPKLPARP